MLILPKDDEIMNGMRTARKYIEKQTTEDLLEIRKLIEDSTEYEEVALYHLIQSELERRKVFYRYLKGRITEEELERYMEE